MPTAMRRFAVARTIGLALAAASWGAAAWLGYEAVRINAEFQEWLVARPMETPIDLSRAGEITVPFRQTCSIAHGESVLLECDLEEAGKSDDGAKQDSEELLKGLEGKIVVKDARGEEAASVELSAPRTALWDDRIMLASFVPFDEGEYLATITINSGAAALAGKRQTLQAQYVLCGLERLPAVISGFFAFGAGVVGLALTICVLPGLLRSGLWHTGASAGDRSLSGPEV